MTLPLIDLTTIPYSGLRLTLDWPLPPPDNACHRSGPRGRYPTTAYLAWLRIATPTLKDALGPDWTPDTERWWEVRGRLWLGSMGDGPNYVKAALDALTGAYAVEHAFTTPEGKRIGCDTILKPGGLWDDDRRVRRVLWETEFRRHATPWMFLEVVPTDPPRDWRGEFDAAEKARKAAERETARLQRAEAKERERLTKLAARKGVGK